MPYPAHLINENEHVALDLQPHWWFFSKHIFTGIPLTILFIALFELHGDVRRGLGWVFAVLAVAWAVWLGIKFLDWKFTHFVVTDRRVIFRTGVLAKHGVEIPLERIMNINFQQRIIDRMIGAGNLDIESAGKGGQSHFDFVRQPDAVQQEIYRQMEKNAKYQAGWSGQAAATAASAAANHGKSAAAPPAPKPADSISDQIEQLAGLRDKGLLTPAEFDAKKAELLQRM